MIPKIKKILYTTDLTENSAYVLRYALNSAEMHDAKIDILYVSQYFVYAFEDAIIENDQEETSAILAKIRKRLDDFVQLELKDNPALIDRVSSIQIVEGNPVVEILKRADELKSDIVIMGTHSKGAIAHTFLGSVASNVLQRIRIPVFIIPLPKE
ncbi:MAG: universal stress protein [Syntrophales bacterium]|nr:universal stress protein [Syntrophales bacterium]